MTRHFMNITVAFVLAVPLNALAKDYRVECPEGARSAGECRVDKGTYQGYRTYSSVCLHCHGAGGLGSTFAPNLLDRMQRNPEYARFEDAVLNGIRGQMGTMKGFESNPQVRKNVENLYAYLKARADGVLPNGRPQRIEETDDKETDDEQQAKNARKQTQKQSDKQTAGAESPAAAPIIDHAKDEQEFALKKQIDGLALWITDFERKLRETPDTHPAVRRDFEALKRLHASITGQYDELLAAPAEDETQELVADIESAIMEFRSSYGALYEKAAVGAF